MSTQATYLTEGSDNKKISPNFYHITITKSRQGHYL